MSASEQAEPQAPASGGAAPEMSYSTVARLASDREARRPIEVRPDRAGTSGYTAVVSLRGEHDLASAVDVREALDSIWGNVLVDLTDCQFIDSTVIGVLIRDYQTRQREDHRLALLVRPENATIRRTLEIAGLRDTLEIHEHLDGLGPPSPSP